MLYLYVLLVVALELGLTRLQHTLERLTTQGINDMVRNERKCEEKMQ